MRSTFWPNRILERQSSQNRETGLKFSSKRENSALFIKIVQNAFFMSCGARLAQMAFLSIKVLNIVTLPQILFKTEKHCAFYENCTKRSFKVMRSTFWPNHIFERLSSQNRETGLKFSSKRENSALFMKIVQNAHFMSCGARFGQIAFRSVKVLKIVKLASNSLQNGKPVRFSWKFSKTLFLGHAEHLLIKWHFWASKFSKSSHCPQILYKTVKQCAFYENCTKRSFQVMRSTFWPNRIFGRQSSQNRETGLKFSSKQENSALSMKIVLNAILRSCGARFGQITLLSVIVLKIVKLGSNSLQDGKSVRFPWKLYKTLFSGHAQHVLAKYAVLTVRVLKVVTLAWNSFKKENSALFIKILLNALFRSVAARFGQIAFLSVKVLKIVKLAANSFENWKTAFFSWKLYKTLFQVTRGTFWPNRILERQSSQNHETRLKFSSRRKNSALFIKIVKNALFRSCGARFVQMACLGIKVLKIVTLAWNSCKNGKTVPFPSKSYKTVISGHAQHVLAKSHFGASKFSKSWNWP